MQAITTETSATHTTICVAGRLDALASPDLWEEIGVAFNENRYDLVIDLTWSSFVDSAGLATLVRAMKYARSNGADVKLIRPKDEMAFRVFELTKFDSVFEFVEAS